MDAWLKKGYPISSSQLIIYAQRYIATYIFRDQQKMDEICAWIQSSTIADSHFNEHKYIHTIYKQYGAEGL